MPARVRPSFLRMVRSSSPVIGMGECPLGGLIHLGYSTVKDFHQRAERDANIPATHADGGNLPTPGQLIRESPWDAEQFGHLFHGQEPILRDRFAAAIAHRGNRPGQEQRLDSRHRDEHVERHSGGEVLDPFRVLRQLIQAWNIR